MGLFGNIAQTMRGNASFQGVDVPEMGHWALKVSFLL
jgi:hypothetical protein